MKKIGRILPKDQLLAALQQKDENGQIVLKLAVLSDNPEAVKTVLNLFPEDERLSAIQQQNKDGKTVLDEATQYGGEEVSRVIREILG